MINPIYPFLEFAKILAKQRTLPTLGATVAVDDLDAFLNGEDSDLVYDFSVENEGEVIDVSLKWKQEPDAQAIKNVAMYAPIAGVGLLGWYIKTFRDRTLKIIQLKQLQAASDVVIEEQKVVQTLDNLKDYFSEVYGTLAIRETTQVIDDVVIIVDELEENMRQLRHSWENLEQWNIDLNAAIASGDKAEEAFVLAKRNQEMVNLSGWQKDILFNQDEIRKLASFKKYNSILGKVSFGISKFLGYWGIVDLGILLGTGVLALVYDEETELEIVNGLIEPIFSGFDSLTYPKGEFAEYYGISLPTDSFTVLLSIAFKEANIKWLQELDIPVQTLREIMLLALAPFSQYMEIVIGNATIIMNYDVSLDELGLGLTSQLMNIPIDYEKIMEMFLGAIAIKSVYHFYAKPLISSFSNK